MIMDITKLKILDTKWVRHQSEENEIIGRWPSDNSVYVVRVPLRVRDELIQLQNALVDKADEARELQNTIAQAAKKLKALNDSLGLIPPIDRVEEFHNSLSSTIPNIGGVIVDSFTSI
jgi:hypothetical protein